MRTKRLKPNRKKKRRTRAYTLRSKQETRTAKKRHVQGHTRTHETKTRRSGMTYVRHAEIISYIYHHFLGDSVRSFFSSRPKYALRGTGILGQIASFERRLRGAAQTPLALPYPFRTSTWTRIEAEGDKREGSFFFVFWAVYARAILGSWRM